MAIPPLNDDERFPRMAHWFSPSLLLALLNNVILSSIFGRYADRRLTIAALDTVTVEEHLKRATALKTKLTSEHGGVVWFDFVADLGDGFDSTYAVATLLGRKELTIAGHTLPRGQILIMGGDEVYPKASRQAYTNQLRQPYAWASPDHDRHSDDGVPVFAIPGNHDWYDGLDLFLAFFCREKHWHLGSWRSQQRRSYFAIQLTDTWWLWATDIQLADTMDQPQADYFSRIATGMPDNSRIIMCSAEPGWLYTDTNNKSWEITDYAVGLAVEAKKPDGTSKGHTVPVLISGDTHHYSRYQAADGTQFITSGGGGAFLHPTHHLEQNISLKWLTTKKNLELGTLPAEKSDVPAVPACYPSMDICRSLVWRNLAFAFTNWDFSLLMGAIYGLCGIAISLRDEWDSYIIITAIFAWAIMGYTTNQEKSRSPDVLINSAVHSAAQAAAIIAAGHLFRLWNEAVPLFPNQWFDVWLRLIRLLAEMGIVGFLVGSTLFGLNLLITCRWMRMNRNDAFSALRLGRYNNFLRLRIDGDQVDIFAVGLDDVPKRDDWITNPDCPAKRDNPYQPVFIAKTSLKPHLIETIGVRPGAP
ncbi:metallophosphoesterase [Bradyrhizobium barranii]|uniref:metallophosphoesterase n=1 Tax=Bradyrhizobium barranii TaxID=2992140 RepID=UPI0024B17006|nr:metallophosphoesterase [Bradyrhizobium barranii]WFT97000.1 metallophosphoesterase [Bradyrhizobium barranii]